MRTRTFCRTAISALIVAAAPLAAAAASNRAWVSGHGVDQTGCGAPTAPCRSLQYAHDQAVVAGGEIDILDPAGYGAITINKSVSIVNDGVGTAGVQATSGAAITISAGATDAIYLRGLNIDGVSFAGEEGVLFLGGGNLTIKGCVIRHFAGDGIRLASAAPTVLIDIAETLVSDNDGNGLSFGGSPTTIVTGVVDHLTADENFAGVSLQTSPSDGAANWVFSNLIAADNSTSGVSAHAGGANLEVTVDNAELNLNVDDGIFTQGGAIVHLNRSTISQNSDGVQNTSGAATIYSAQNNLISGNFTHDITGGVLTAEPLK